MRKTTARTALIVGVGAALGLTALATLWPAPATARTAAPAAPATARSAAPATRRTSCYAVSPATDPPAQCLAMTDPDAAGLAIWGVPGGPAGGPPETEWFDFLGQPIASMGQAGGFKVFGDQICVYPPTSVYVPDACLRDNGTITVGGQALSASDIAWLHAARAADPTGTSACASRPADSTP